MFFYIKYLKRQAQARQATPSSEVCTGPTFLSHMGPSYMFGYSRLLSLNDTITFWQYLYIQAATLPRSCTDILKPGKGWSLTNVQGLGCSFVAHKCISCIIPALQGNVNVPTCVLTYKAFMFLCLVSKEHLKCVHLASYLFVFKFLL